MVIHGTLAAVLIVIGPIVWALLFWRREGQEYHPAIAALCALVIMVAGSMALTGHIGSSARSLNYSFYSAAAILGAGEIVLAVLYALIRHHRKRTTAR